MRVISSFLHLDAVRVNAMRVSARTGVDLIGVLKVDAYGLGSARGRDDRSSCVGLVFILSQRSHLEANLGTNAQTNSRCRAGTRR